SNQAGTFAFNMIVSIAEACVIARRVLCAPAAASILSAGWRKPTQAATMRGIPCLSVADMNARKSVKPISLTQFLIQEQRGKNHINADLRLLIEVVARACKAISIAVGKGALGGVLGSAGTENVQGEVQKKLDVLSNEILLEANEWGGHLAALASEEMDDPHP